MIFRKTEQKKYPDSYQPDWEAKDIWIEVKTRPQAIRSVRDGLFQLAYAIAERSSLRAFLLLIEPRITQTRLYNEWQKFQMTFRSQVIKRLSMIIYKENKFIGIPADPDTAIYSGLEQICRDELLYRGTLLPGPDYNSEIIKILIYRWLMNQGPTTLNWLAKITGCNYRTVAKTLYELGNSITRLTDRRVKLRFFPKDVWAQLLTMSKKSRMTKIYTDRSGQPRSITSLIQRLKRLQRPEIAICGVPGTRRLYPEIDVIGTPRLDLTIHCPGKYTDISFIKQLDPALKTVDDPDTPAALCLHFIRRKEPFFEIDTDGVQWGDPVECLLDLHDAKLETQALELLNYLKPKENNS